MAVKPHSFGGTMWATAWESASGGKTSPGFLFSREFIVKCGDADLSNSYYSQKESIRVI
jgi:hypothetical protein